MCIICLELQKGALTPWEAKRNLREMTEKIGQEHAIEVGNIISDAIFEEVNLNYGDTISQDVEFCKYCQCTPCDCSWGED